MDRVGKRPMQRPRVDDARPHRRRVLIPGELLFRRVRRQTGAIRTTSANAKQRLHGERTRGPTPRIGRARAPTSAARIPAARNAAPTAAQPGDEVGVARHQRLLHQPAESRPRRHDLHGERSAEERADDDAVDREDRPERLPPARDARRRAIRECRAPAPPIADGRASACAIDSDCSRSSIAATGRASASVGTM